VRFHPSARLGACPQRAGHASQQAYVEGRLRRPTLVCGRVIECVRVCVCVRGGCVLEFVMVSVCVCVLCVCVCARARV
jgi:hypothetical protein